MKLNRRKVLVSLGLIAAVALSFGAGMTIGHEGATASPSLLDISDWCIANGGRPYISWTHVWGNWTSDGNATIEGTHIGNGTVDLHIEQVTCQFPTAVPR